MSGIVSRLVVLAIAIPSVGAYTTWKTNKRIETYHITEIDQPIMDKCSRWMTGKDVTFADGASAENGCACIAKHATSEIKQSRLPVFTETLDVTMNLAKSTMHLDEDDTAAQIKAFTTATERYTAIQMEAKMYDAQYTALTTKIMDYITVCGQKATHKGESLARIAALQPRGTVQAAAKIAPEPKKSDEDIVKMLR